MNINRLNVTASYTRQSADALDEVVETIKSVNHTTSLLDDYENLASAGRDLQREARVLREYAGWLDGVIGTVADETKKRRLRMEQEANAC